LLDIFNIFFLWVPILVRVAFLTLLERKVLGLRQLRKGPNKVSWLGVLQPIGDAVKLFTKEVVAPTSAIAYLFIFAPVLAITLILLS